MQISNLSPILFKVTKLQTFQLSRLLEEFHAVFGLNQIERKAAMSLQLSLNSHWYRLGVNEAQAMPQVVIFLRTLNV